MSAELDVVLSKLTGVKREGSGYKALCPIHREQTASLDVKDGEKCVVLKCFGCGATADKICPAIGLTVADLFFTARNGTASNGTSKQPLTLKAFASRKGFTTDFLTQHAVREDKGGLVFHYLTLDGQKAARQRIRLALAGDKTFIWSNGNGRPVPYGLWRLDDARKHGVRELLLCEGESDALTFWNHNIAALGIPGADMCSILNEPHTRGFSTILICREPDAGGETFIKGMTGRLAQLRFRGIVKVVDYSRAKVKDANDLHVKYLGEAGAFESEFDAIRELAETVTLPIAGMIRRTLSAVAPEKIVWQWENRIPLSKPVLFAGESDIGKSTVSRYIGARISRGEAWPDGRRACAAGNVLILSAEDGVADVIRPSMEALGADLDRVEVVEVIRTPNRDGELIDRGFNLATDIPHLEHALEESNDARLVIIDPVSSYMGGVDSHKNSDVRSILAPLTKLAEKYRTTIILVTHLNKGSGPAKQRVTGSIAFEAAARTAYLFARDPQDNDAALFLPMKNNLGPKDNGLKYRLEHNGRGVVVTWSGETDLRPDDVMAQEEEERREQKFDRHDRAQAMAFLVEYLCEGPKPVKEVETVATAKGIAERTLERARADLKLKPYREGYQGPFYLSLKSVRE